ncbi:MAG: acetyl-CoA hydrolase/transferase C-terminal domain-containing protein [Myxococcota bacterium]
MQGWQERAVDAAEVVTRVPKGARVFVQGAAMTPTPLLQALQARTDVEGVRLYHLHLSGLLPHLEEPDPGRILDVSLFTGPGCRAAIAEGHADFVPVFLGRIPGLFRERTIPLDVAFVQLSPPDSNGLCSLGTSVDATRAAVDAATLVLAVINPRVPRTHGHSFVPFSCVDAFCSSDVPLYAHDPVPPTKVEEAIGSQVAALVPDGATLQLGIGAIPDAVLARLGDKHELGVHTEMFSDGLLPLLEGGVVTNRRKTVHPGRTTTTFVAGSQALYDYVDDDPRIEFHPCDRTNDTRLIQKNPQVVAINSALEVDLSGQVCADSIGARIYSGIGGQMDFMHGAAMSRGGLPIIALPSTAGGGRFSRIVPTLKPGAGVVTTRGHVRWVVTEHGAVNLHGMTLRERGEALISIAHPDWRGTLRRDFQALRHFPPASG